MKRSISVIVHCVSRNINAVLVFVLIATLLSCSKSKDDACNGELIRRDVKIAIDQAASEINLQPIEISVTEIGDLEVGNVSKSDPRQEVEKNVYTITAKVEKLSMHRDGDWKVKLRDYDKYINCESPNPGCEYVENSIFKDQYVEVRDWIEANKNDLEGKYVTITGVGFVDIDHVFPRNAADNEMELHPILSISW